MKTKVMTREELEAALRRVLSDVTDADERHFVVGHLFNYANTMDLVQQIPTALRLKFFACAFSGGRTARTGRSTNGIRY